MQLQDTQKPAVAGNLDALWSTSIYRAQLDIDQDVILAAILALRKEPNYAGGYTTYHDTPYLHKQSPFRELSEEIMRHAHVYMPPHRGRLELAKNWASIMPTGGAHPAHTHPLSYISGTYYPKTLGSIVFHDPRVGAVAGSITPDPIVGYPAKAGMLILFPSWLMHEVPVNLSDEDRVSYSFNISNPQD